MSLHLIHHCRVVNVRGGAIEIDGVNIRDVGLDTLRSRLATASAATQELR